MSALKHIRTKVFKVTQHEFAELIGVQQSTVSRWERGGAPTLTEMQRIREAASTRKVKWSDRLFFDTPPATPERASA